MCQSYLCYEHRSSYLCYLCCVACTLYQFLYQSQTFLISRDEYDQLIADEMKFGDVRALFDTRVKRYGFDAGTTVQPCWGCSSSTNSQPVRCLHPAATTSYSREMCLSTLLTTIFSLSLPNQVTDHSLVMSQLIMGRGFQSIAGEASKNIWIAHFLVKYHVLDCPWGWGRIRWMNPHPKIWKIKVSNYITQI